MKKLILSASIAIAAVIPTSNADALNYNPGQEPGVLGQASAYPVYRQPAPIVSPADYQPAPIAPPAAFPEQYAPSPIPMRPMPIAAQQPVVLQPLPPTPIQAPIPTPIPARPIPSEPVLLPPQIQIPEPFPTEVSLEIPAAPIPAEPMQAEPMPEVAIEQVPEIPQDIEMAAPPAPEPISNIISGTYTLEQAMTQTYQTNPEHKAAIAQLEALNENEFEAFSGWLPTVSGSGSYGGQDSEVGGRTIREDGSLTYRINASQPLFRGGATVFAQDRAENQVEAGRQRYKNAEQGILLQAVETYMNLIRDRGIYELSILNEEALEKQLQSSKERFELGEITLTDVAQSESRLALAKADKVTSEGQLISAESTFERVVGVKPDSLVKPANLPKIPPSLQAALDIAMKNSPTILAAEHDREAAEDSINERYSGLSPTLSLNGGYEHQEDSLFAGDIDSTTYSVNFNVPLYQAGTEYSAIRRAKRNAENAKQQTVNAKRQVNANVVRAWKNVETFSSTIEANKKAVEASKIAFEAAQEESVLGTRSILDVLDAEREYFSSQISLLRAETNYVVSIYSLLAQIGVLTADNLKLPVNIYNADDNGVKYQLIGW